jgi:hypothetical protein
VYINTCCYGGDVVSDRLLPLVNEGYSSVQHNQEDWGWFIWFRRGKIELAIDIFCDNTATGAFRIHRTSRQRRLWFLDRVSDTPELEELKERMTRVITQWVGPCPRIVALDDCYMPKKGAS